MVPSILQGIYPFDKIPAAKFGFEKFSGLSERHFYNNNWIHTFPKVIINMLNAISLVQGLNLRGRVRFLTTITIIP